VFEGGFRVWTVSVVVEEGVLFLSCLFLSMVIYFVVTFVCTVSSEVAIVETCESAFSDEFCGYDPTTVESEVCGASAWFIHEHGDAKTVVTGCYSPGGGSAVDCTIVEM
jgi:hypothetical protein